jgi:HAD superfamily hydrolase (TIGR01662 family)
MTGPPTPEGVILDFGDTILREGPVDFAAGVRAVLALAGRAGDEDLARDVGTALRDLIDDLNPRRQAAMIEPPPETVWRLVYEPRGLVFDADPADVEWAFWRAATTWHPEPGVEDALAALTARGVALAVLSNTMFRERTIVRQLRTSGITTDFRFVMTSADYVLRKPHARLFRMAAQRLGLHPSRIWFIGDSMENDIVGASAAGMVPIWYRREETAASHEPAAHVVASWASFASLLTTLPAAI